MRHMIFIPEGTAFTTADKVGCTLITIGFVWGLTTAWWIAVRAIGEVVDMWAGK